MKHLWSSPDEQWNGFQPVPYWLDVKKVLALPLTLEDPEVSDKKTASTTVGEICKTLLGQHVEIESSVDTEITAESGKLVVTGPSFNREILEILLSLRQDGTNGFEALWFWYNSDSCRQDPQDSYTFFVVAKDRIAREQVMFFDAQDSGFDPSVFESEASSPFVWFGDKAWRDAKARFWYRKFYAETRMGQLMTLRTDQPRLHYYDGPTDGRIGNLPMVANLLNKVYFLLWILVILAALELILRWK
jgi:hypothetical protein